ncbi:MAG: biotin--[acetyl-CoA-carboxylase] ligase, partial [Oscillibacter sp.]|nr:biotin--[acetyl-CoA-carboxylase] ligase [Oscillibacter sp.]
MGKETVLALLLREKGRFVSGEAVSAELGITRAAIWKSISALRAQGYEIEAVPGRGYCLKALPDVLSEQTVRSFLGGVQVVGGRIDCFDTIDSTNAYLKRIALDGAPDGTVAVAAEQTSGRGRRGRTFQSAAGKGVYLSVLLRPELTPAQLMPLTGFVAVAMSRAVDRVGGTNVQIKWTNDLVLNGRKLCGILTELSVEGETGALQYVVPGIGINVSQCEEDFDGDVAQIATSILRETGRRISRAELAAAMIEELDALYA